MRKQVKKTLAPERVIPFREFAETLELLDMLISYKRCETPDVGSLGTLIVNDGDILDKAEALLAVAPLARRVFERSRK